MSTQSNGDITYYLQTKLFVGEVIQEISSSPFVIIPDGAASQDSNLQLKFLRSILNFKETILKEESKELEWKPQTRKGKAIFPRIVQALKIEGNEYEITLFPVGNEGLPGFKIHVSLVKSLLEDKGKALYSLKAVYEELSGGRIFKTEIRDIGNIFFICFPIGKRIYVLSFFHIAAIGSPVY